MWVMWTRGVVTVLGHEDTRYGYGVGVNVDTRCGHGAGLMRTRGVGTVLG